MRPKQSSLADDADPAAMDGLDAFAPDPAKGPEDAKPDTPRDAAAKPRRVWPFVVVGVAVLTTAVGAWAYNGGWLDKLLVAAADPASLTLNTTPVGAQVSINGVARGATPLSLSLAAGTYHVRVTSPAGQERSFTTTLTAGQSVVQQIEWAAAPAAAPASTGALHVQTDPAGQAVVVDDVRRGVSPLTIGDLTPGEHRLVVTSDAGSYRRAITINAGETLSVVVAPHAPAVSAGFLRVTSPILLQIRSRGNLIGNTESDRVMLAAGEHEIEMTNESLGFSRSQRVTINAGRTAEVRVAVPNGLLSINAVPWAEVWLNNERLGETPIANLSRPIGTYRVVFRHPQFGERQATLTVSANETARLGVDMRQPR